MRVDPDVLRLDIAMHDAVEILATDRHLELVRVLERPGDRDRGIGRELRNYRTAAQPLGEVLPVDVLHCDVEEAVAVAAVVDADYARIHLGEPRLQLRAAALGLDRVARVGVLAMLDQLERDLSA